MTKLLNGILGKKSKDIFSNHEARLSHQCYTEVFIQFFDDVASQIENQTAVPKALALLVNLLWAVGTVLLF